MNWGDITRLNVSGMSWTSAQGYGYSESGVAGSERAANDDFAAARQYKSYFQQAGDQNNIPMEVIAAISSRESRCGNDGYYRSHNGYGFDGQGFGLMQVDSKVHEKTINLSAGPNSYENVSHGARILEYFYGWMKNHRSHWSREQQLQGAVAAYNCGERPIPPDYSSQGVDEGTHHKDYSNDVIARAKYFKKMGL